MPAVSVASTLEERGARYGKFQDHALIAMSFKGFMRGELTRGYSREEVEAHLAQQKKNWTKLAPDQQQALDTICDKIARILNGDPDYTDNWHDIQGYAKLVEDRLLQEQTP